MSNLWLIAIILSSAIILIILGVYTEWDIRRAVRKAKQDSIIKVTDSPAETDIENSLKYMVDNIGQPNSLETREGFDKAKAIVDSLRGK